MLFILYSKMFSQMQKRTFAECYFETQIRAKSNWTSVASLFRYTHEKISRSLIRVVKLHKNIST